jgi:phospholipid transport system substrate-binding protein
MTSNHRISARTAAVLTCVLGILATQAPAETGTEAEAVAVVTRFQQQILDADARLSEAPFEERYQAFAPIVTESHDLGYMARVTMSRAWRSVEPDGRAQFLVLFRELSIASYATQFSGMAGARFSVEGHRTISGGRVEVQTVLSPAGEDAVALVYLLHPTDAGWRVINVLAEGVSDLALKRSQYQQILKTQGFEAVLTHLRRQIDALRAS